MLTFLLGMATGALACLVGVLIDNKVDERRDERTLKRSRDEAIGRRLDVLDEDCRVINYRLRNFRSALDDSFVYHIDRFHKKGKK